PRGRDRARAVPGARGLRVVGDRARVPRVRAHEHDGARRVRAARLRALRRAARVGAPRARIRRAVPEHALGRRRDAGGAGGGGASRPAGEAGLRRVGPRSAGAEPGPIAYGRGGVEPTVTDAAIALGYIDTRRFLGGAMPLDAGAASAGLARAVGDPLGVP